jgi:hypothetical protein
VFDENGRLLVTETAPREPLIATGIPWRRPPSEPGDRVLRNAKIVQLHGALKLQIEPYVGLYETGSLTAGDPWVEGRSDRDILIVIEGVIGNPCIETIAGQLDSIGFNDTYLFNPAPKHAFLGTHSDHDIAMKFRGTTLFGPDLIAEKETPTRAFAEQWALGGLRQMAGKLRIRVLNSGCWSVEHLRDDIYFLLKQTLLFLADKKYADTGHYPRRREDVASAYASDELRALAGRMVTIDQADKASLVQIAESATTVVQQYYRQWSAFDDDQKKRNPPQAAGSRGRTSE